MLDSYNKTNQSIEFHSVSGIMCKSHPESIICEVSKDSLLLDTNRPRLCGNGYEVYDVVVLQVMIIEGGFIVEYVPKKVYEAEGEDI